jgi:hypothetical protein
MSKLIQPILCDECIVDLQKAVAAAYPLEGEMRGACSHHGVVCHARYDTSESGRRGIYFMTCAGPGLGPKVRAAMLTSGMTRAELENHIAAERSVN